MKIQDTFGGLEGKLKASNAELEFFDNMLKNLSLPDMKD